MFPIGESLAIRNLEPAVSAGRERPAGDGGPHVPVRCSPVAGRGAGARGLRGKREQPAGDGGLHVAARRSTIADQNTLRRSPVAGRGAGARGLRGKRCPRVGNGGLQIMDV